MERKLIAEVTPEAIHINLKGPAREGKANSELLKKLSKMLKISSTDIRLVAGHKSKEKTILIVGLDTEELTNRLLNLT